MSRVRILGGALALSVLAVAYLLHTWGVWGYIRSVAGPIQPSPNSHKSAGTLLYKAFAKGEVLLIHGLNFDADKLLPLAHVFHEAGYQVKVPRLAGHRGNLKETFSDTSQAWNDQFNEFNKDFKTPEVCSGYSLGGLLPVERFLNGKLNCERFVLFAPAFSTNTPGRAAEFLEAVLPRDFQVPSGIPGDYKHFAHLGLGPTFALMKAVNRFSGALENLAGKNIPPGLVFLDPRDNVINASMVRDIVKKYFPKWKLVEVEALPLNESHGFHMIIDEVHLGPTQWKIIKDEITAFLKQ